MDYMMFTNSGIHSSSHFPSRAWRDAQTHALQVTHATDLSTHASATTGKGNKSSGMARSSNLEPHTSIQSAKTGSLVAGLIIFYCLKHASIRALHSSMHKTFEQT